VILVYVVIRT